MNKMVYSLAIATLLASSGISVARWVPSKWAISRFKIDPMLEKAVESGNHEEAKKLIQQGARVAGSPLYAAVYYDYEKLAYDLMDEGLEVPRYDPKLYATQNRDMKAFLKRHKWYKATQLFNKWSVLGLGFE